MSTEDLARNGITDSPAEIDQTSLEVAPEAELVDGFTKGEVRRNMSFCVLMDSIGLFGGTEYMLALGPLLVWLGASNTWIGSVGSAGQAFSLIGAFLTPWISRRFIYKKWLFFCLSVPCWLVILASGLVLVLSRSLGLDRSWLLVFVTVMAISQTAIAGFTNIPHQEYIAACIPSNYRGRLSGMSISVGTAASIGVNSICGYILLTYAKPMSFGYIFIMSWVILQAGITLALFAKEKPTPIQKSERAWTRQALRTTWNDKRFIRFLCVAGFVNLILQPAANFVPIYAYKALNMNLAYAAVFANIGLIARLVLSTPSGFLADRLGPQKVIPYWGVGFGLSYLLPFLIHGPWGVFLSVAIVSAANGFVFPSVVALVYAIPKHEHRANYFSFQFLSMGICAAAGGYLMGRMFDLVKYVPMFGILTIISFLCYPFFKWLLSIIGDDALAHS